MKLAFIGGGTMAEAIIGGVLSRAIAGGGDISVGEVLEERRQVLAERYGVVATADNLEAARGSDLMVISVKPQDLQRVLSQLRGSLADGQTALSIVAGARMSAIQEGLGHPSVVRVMPNTPAQIGEGVSLWTCSPQVGEEARELARSVLVTMGEEIYVGDEKYLDMATAVSASGPAYVFPVHRGADRRRGAPGPAERHGTKAIRADGAGQCEASQEYRDAPRRAQELGYLSRWDHGRGVAGPGRGRFPGHGSQRGDSRL